MLHSSLTLPARHSLVAFANFAAATSVAPAQGAPVVTSPPTPGSRDNSGLRPHLHS